MTIPPAKFSQHPALVVLDGADLLHIDFNDLLKYHGLGSIAGVAIAFRVLTAALARLSAAGPIERRSITILTAFPGPGAADAFEMVTRGRSEDRYRVDPQLAVPQAAPAAKGRYFFQFTTPQAVCALGLHEGVVFPEFLALLRQQAQQALTTEEISRLRELKFLLAERVLALPEAELLSTVPSIPVSA